MRGDTVHSGYLLDGRAETERDGTRAETRFGFPAKRTSPFISAGVSVHSAAGSRGVRISGSNAGQTVSDTVHDCWLLPPFAFFPFTSPPVRFRVPSHSVSALPRFLVESITTSVPLSTLAPTLCHWRGWTCPEAICIFMFCFTNCYKNHVVRVIVTRNKHSQLNRAIYCVTSQVR